MTDCNSKTHRAYTDASEGVRIQSMLIKHDAERAVAADSLGERLRILETIAERVTFAQDNLADAEQAVHAHLRRGCAALAAVSA